MVTLDAFSELLQACYAAPLQSGQWERFLDLLCAHTGSGTTLLICANSRGTLSIRACGGTPLDAAIVETYASHYAAEDPFRIPMLRAARTGLADCEELVPSEVLLRSKMFQHLQQPLGYRYPGLMILTCSLRRLEVVSLWRTPEQGPLDPQSNRLLELLVPHLQSALEIREALGVAHLRATGAEAMADASTTATFLLGIAGEIRHCNAAARAMLQAGDGLHERNGALRATHPSGRDPLRNLLRRASAETLLQPSGFPARGLLLERRSGLRPLQLLASPLASNWNGNEKDGSILLLVTDPEKPVRLQEDLLRTQFNITGAEMEVATGLLTGYSLEEISILRRVSVGTIRHQLKSLFRKTDTKGQPELVKLMLSLPQVEN